MWRVLHGAIPVTRRDARWGRAAVAAAGWVALVARALSSGLLVAVAVGSVPIVAVALTWFLLAGWAAVAARLIDRSRAVARWLGGRGRARPERFVELRQLLEGERGVVREVRFRGGDPLLDAGELVAVVVVPVGRRRYALWAKHLARGERWVSSSLTWAVFGSVILLVATVQR